MYTISILGYTYNIDTSKLLSEMDGNVGFANFEKKVIDVAHDVDIEIKVSTLLHEIIEVVNYHLEIGLTEAQIKQLEVGLHRIVWVSICKYFRMN